MLGKSDIKTRLFWGSIVVLLGASLFYGVGAERMRRSALGDGGKIENGSLVRLVRVIDGDTVVVAAEGQTSATVRILGIKAFDANVEKDVVTPFAHGAVETLRRLMADKLVRVLLHTTPKDRFGRFIATLYADDQDIGLRLVKEGLVLVYTVYPFPAMSLYLQEQELARAERRGLWASDEATSRALALIHAWRGDSQ